MRVYLLLPASRRRCQAGSSAAVRAARRQPWCTHRQLDEGQAVFAVAARRLLSHLHYVLEWAARRGAKY